ncbi:unnamed protein product [Durusdinium trenchii]|uniref:Uncharacterized protein n=1 Tax=Durusdinium trenchii TaxID=1381693 RepID=A0ABP0MBN7_9DINO
MVLLYVYYNPSLEVVVPLFSGGMFQTMDHEVKVYVFHVFSKRDLRNATFDDDMGWNFNGFGPWGCLDASDQWCFHCYHVGGECGQGLFYNLFYLADSVFSWALAAEGAVRPIGVMLDGCRWLHENSVRVRGFPTVPSPCEDFVQQGRCGEIVAYHKVIEGRGCALKLLPEGKLKLFPSDEDESLYIGSTQPTYAIEEAEQREKRTVWLERVEEDGI